MQGLGTVPATVTGTFAPPAPNVCTSMSYQYDCVVGTAHVGTVCVPLCPNSAGAPPCIPCEDVRANCAWVRDTACPLNATACCSHASIVADWHMMGAGVPWLPGNQLWHLLPVQQQPGLLLRELREGTLSTLTPFDFAVCCIDSPVCVHYNACRAYFNSIEMRVEGLRGESCRCGTGLLLALPAIGCHMHDTQGPVGLQPPRSC